MSTRGKPKGKSQGAAEAVGLKDSEQEDIDMSGEALVMSTSRK